jgi:gamma-glutamylputrescine oxidase
MREFPIKTSFWHDADIATTASLQNNQITDVAIIGGGFAGLSTAFHLRRQNSEVRITLIEAQHIGYGASGRNAGWVQNFPPVMWFLNNMSDPEKRADIARTAQMCQANIDEIGAWVQSEGIACDWTHTQNMMVARNFVEEATLKWIAPRFEAGGVPVTFLEGDAVRDLVGYDARMALAYDVVTIQPYRLAQGLRNWLLANDVTIYENTPVAHVQNKPDGARIITERGYTLDASKVVLATNAYTKSMTLDVTPPSATLYHTYVLATQPLEPAMLNRISQARKPFVDAALRYYIGRIHGNQFIFNGIDRISQNTPADDAHLPSYETLYREMVGRFPFLQDVPLAAAWGGAVQQTHSDAPVVRPATENPNIIFNLGYGGSSGVGMALLSGRLLTDLLLEGQHDANATRLRRLFDESHFPIMGPARAVTGVLQAMIQG